MCNVLDVPRSTYYQSRSHTISNHERENIELTDKIIEIHEKSHKRYGASKTHYIVLIQSGYSIGLNRVHRLMKETGIRSIIVKKSWSRPSKERVIKHDNLLVGDLSSQTINEKWVGNITYINTLRHGWCYLASVMDLHSKKIVWYSFSQTMSTELVIKALENAYHTQTPDDGLIIHSDLGTQYASDEF